MKHVREMVELVDAFIAPARYLNDHIGMRSGSLHASSSISTTASPGSAWQAASDPREPFTFGYIGTHIPAKGIHDLIRSAC